MTTSYSRSTCGSKMFLAGLVAALALGGLQSSAVEPDDRSLRQIYQETQSRADSAEEAQVSINAYRTIVETHLENHRLYQNAIRELADAYEQAGKPEEAIRFFLKLLGAQQNSGREDALREVFTKYRLSHPDLLKKIVKDLQGSSRSAAPPPAAMSSKDLSQAILQRESADLRAKSLEKLKAMLAESSTQSQQTALATLRMSMQAKFDRKPFRPLVIPLLQSDEARVREMAVTCIGGLEPTSDDLALIAPLADDESPGVRKVVGGTMIHIGKGEHSELVVPVLMKLLRDSDHEVIERNLRSMWGEYSEPEFNELLIALANEPSHHGSAIYHSLSTMRNKTVAVCRRLVKELDDPNWNNSGRAAWGLGYGVPPEANSLVEEGLLKALPQETNAYTRQQELRALRNVASEKSRRYLKMVVDSELETDEIKQAAQEILRKLDE